jgi:nitrate reductase cytochrome c-type subunit
VTARVLKDILPILSAAAVVFANPAIQKPAQLCEKCHPNESHTQTATPMAHAAARAADAVILKDHPMLRVTRGRYTFVIRREPERVTYSVSAGTKTFSAPIVWAFGFGDMGQTYLYEYRGNLFESQVSFYNALDGLDLTIGHRSPAPSHLEEAAGRPIQKAEIGHCFGCHTTGTVDAISPGVGCERCHKNAEEHARALTDQTAPSITPEKLSHLSVEEQSDFCGGCHRTWQEVSANGPHDINNIRFQPYRLATSKCYNSSVSDKRISCVACHDPHQDLVKSAEYYDAHCGACHGAGNPTPSAKICPVAQHGCVTCHMPKIDFPNGHFKFTDHRIRVIRSGAVYPS